MARSTARRTQGGPNQLVDLLLGPAMIFPALLGLALFQFLPLATAVSNSLRSFNPFTHRPKGWAGLDHYQQIFRDPNFGWASLTTIAYIVLILMLTIPLAISLAVLLDRRLPATTFARSAILGALAASEAVTALIWNQMYEPNTGLFNTILTSIGVLPQPFLTESHQAIFSIAVMSVWKDVGLSTLIFLAGLQVIPDDLAEAAALDGASRAQIFWRVTLPLLRPSLVLAVFMTTVGATRLFTPIILLTQGGPNGATQNLVYYSYSHAFEFNSPGPASASVVCMLALLVLITLVQARLLRGRSR
jgi:ABC-type sugar transport system permease subunit